ncbi:MAG: hypothetical protein IJK27_02870 [Bacilli bacterium]|nr:hypothetical protein [Bacilli bacterium]
MIIGQILEALWTGIKVGFHAFFSVLPIYNQLSDFKTQMIALALGVPTILIAIGGIAIKVFKFVNR